MIEPSMNRSLPWFMSYLWHGVYTVGSARVVIEPLLTFTKRHTQRPYQNWRVLFPCLSTSAFIQTLTVISQPNLICHLSLGAEQPKAGSGWVERNSESYRWSYCKVVFNWWAHQGFTTDTVYPIGLFSLPPGMIISTCCSSPKWMPRRQKNSLTRKSIWILPPLFIWPG